MSENFQSGYHPDADQIGAFVERALPAHEREQMLDHLAGCGECRAIVALSLPEAEEPAKPLPAITRRPWWVGWSLAWPAAVAIAALSFIVLYVHHAAIAPATPGASQVAGSHPPAAPMPRVEARAAVAGKSVHGSAATASGGDTALSVSHAGSVAGKKSEIQLNDKPVDSAVLTGRDAAELMKMMPAPPPVPTASSGATGGFVAAPGGSAAGYGSGNGYGPGTAANPSARAHAGADGLIPARPAPAPMLPAQSASSTPESPSQVVSSQSVTVISGQDAEVPVDNSEVSATLNNELVTQFERPLPSRLPVLSMVARGALMVAIDTRNALWVSKDVGKHWTAIRAKWPGRAVKASLVEFAATGPTASDRNVGYLAGDLKSLAAGLAGKPTEPRNLQSPSLRVPQGPSITGTVTDQTGAVIPGASVTVIDTLTGDRRDSATDTAGRYVVVGLAPGTYQVEVHAKGFAMSTLASVAVAASDQSVANLTLTISSASQSVTVISESSPLSTETVDVTADEKLAQTPAADVSAARKKKARQATVAQSPSPALFEITTDAGDKWTSADGVIWTRR